MKVMNDWKVIKLGGSLLSPYETASRSLQLGQLPFDTEYAKELLAEVKKSGKKIVFIVGGGFLNRWYLQQFRELKFDKPETVTDFHYLGMAASDINAILFRILAGEIFGFENVYPTVVKYDQYNHLREESIEFEKYQVIVAAGWKPGHSHDVDALMFSALFNTGKMFSFKNIDGIYSADPKQYPTAMKKKSLKWAAYRDIIKVTTHKPGASFPVDAIAAQLAERMNKQVVVIDGRDMRAVREVLMDDLTTRGTTIT